MLRGKEVWTGKHGGERSEDRQEVASKILQSGKKEVDERGIEGDKISKI